MVKPKGMKSKVYHPYFKMWLNSAGVISMRHTLSSYDTLGMEETITRKSLESLKLNPIPFYVKPETPVIEEAQQLCRKLEGTNIWTMKQ